MLDIINQANALDRRRQAQIENQRKSITRLLNAGIGVDDTTTPEARYTDEMAILHEGAAVLRVQLEDTERALRDLVAAVDALPDSRAQGDRAAGEQLAHALAAARGLVAASALVSESGDEAG